jgi:transglutaminase-like putative cysteine protease
MNNMPIHRIAEETAHRTSILALSFSFFMAMLPHFLNLPLWVTAFALFSLAWRSAQSYGYGAEMPKWLLIPLVLIGGIGVFAQYWTIVGREPGLALLTVMTSFKFLETKTHRDILILVFLCYFLLATHFLFSQSIQIAVYMFAVLIIITTTLITINQRDPNSPLLPRVKAATRLIGLSIPIMIILFILVPRIPGPIWGLTQEQRGGVTGLSETMSPGQISDLITSNEVAFRVKFEGPYPEQSQLYWRGPVMVNFNGSTWRQTRHRKLKQLDIRQSTQTTEYTVTLEPHGKNWIFGLDIPTSSLPDSYMSSEYQLTSTKAINDLKRYTLTSHLSYLLAVDESMDYLLHASQIPEDKNPQTVALGRKWSQQFDSDTAIVQNALEMFRNENYVYTLQPPLLGSNPADEFLFQTRRGFCEHYASSFALLMRAAGIPTRIVTGYQGGEINDIGDYLMVRQSDAHAWTEVWLEGRGWIRVDPTAAVSPDRIENGLDRALPGALSSFKIGEHNALIGRVLYNWDNLQNTWNAWVLNYDQYKQAQFLKNLGLGIKSWGDMVITLVICLVLISAMYWGISWYRERPSRPAEYEVIINSILKKLARHGHRRIPSEQLPEFLQRIQQQHDYEDPELEQIFQLYQRIKYARGYQKQTVIKQFRRMAAEWKMASTTSS